ncbi:MAG: hypothetical protein H6811_08790 [Phycisphaeraceae bacterium]|nr:hypothetical protein [Phycisphaeraceae bacterium]
MGAELPDISPDQRDRHHADLLALTSVPTAAGHEHRAIEWIERWVAQRPDLDLTKDATGNLFVSCRGVPKSDRPLLITAHLDHPAFHVERVRGREIELTFRGGVLDDYFIGARVAVHAPTPVRATIHEPTGSQEPFKRFIAMAEDDAPSTELKPGLLATWDLPASEILPDPTGSPLLHAPVCDDLAAAGAALAAMDSLLCLAGPNRLPDVRLLFTLAEEVGFIGAIGACAEGSIPHGARLVALENSRELPEARMGDGPIVRVGDRLSIFSPSLTAAIDKRCERIAGGSKPTASQRLAAAPAWKWQRKLMSGGACEASVFCAYGHEATCVCLALGNYHNMANLADVQAGVPEASAQIAREYISLTDFDGLVDLLVACSLDLPEAPDFRHRLEKLWRERGFVLAEDARRRA